MTTLERLEVVLTGDTSSFSSAMNNAEKQAQTTVSKVSSGMQNLGKSMFRTGRTLTTGLTLPLVGFGKVALDEFTELQRVNASSQAVLKSTGGVANVTMGDIHDLSASLGDLTAQDAEAVQGTENLLLTFKNIRNEVGKGNDVFNQASLAIQDLSAGMNQDAKASAIQLGKALNDPIKGVTALSRVGVTFSAQQVKQIGLLVEHNDLLGAQKIILGEINSEFGGQAKALGATASPMTRLNLAFHDLAETMGRTLAPTLTKAAKWLQGVFTWIEKLSPTTKKWAVYVGIALAVLGPLVLILGALVTAIGVLISPVTLVVLAVAAVVAAFFKFGPVVKNVLTVLFPIIGLIRLVVANFDLLKRAVMTVVDAFAGGWTGIKALFMRGVNAIVGVLSRLPQTLLRLGGQAIKALWEGIKAAVPAVINFFVNLPSKIGSLIGKLIPILARAGLHALKSFWTAVINFWPTLKTWFSELPGKIVTAVGQLDTLLFNAGKAVIQGFIDGVKANLPNALNLFTDLTKKLPGLKGPRARDLKLLRPAGEAIMTGLVAGLRSGERDVYRTLQGVTTNIGRGNPTVHVGVGTPSPSYSRAASAGGGAHSMKGVRIAGELSLRDGRAYIEGVIEDTLDDGQVIDRALTRAVGRSTH